MPYLIKKGRNSFKRVTLAKPRPKRKAQTQITSFFAKKVKAVINSNEEPRHLYTNAEMIVPASGGWYTVSLTSAMTQGDTNTSRQGDEIHVEALKLAFQFSNTAGAGQAYADVWYRVIVGKWKSLEINTGNAFSASNAGVTQALTYINNTSYTGIDGIIDPRFVSVVYDRKIHLKPNYDGAAGGTTPQVVTAFVDAKLKLNYDLKFRQGSTNYAQGMFKNLYIAVIPFNQNGASDCGRVSVVADLIWKEK